MSVLLVMGCTLYARVSGNYKLLRRSPTYGGHLISFLIVLRYDTLSTGTYFIPAHLLPRATVLRIYSENSNGDSPTYPSLTIQEVAPMVRTFKVG